MMTLNEIHYNPATSTYLSSLPHHAQNIRKISIESINAMQVPISSELLLCGNEILTFKDNVTIFKFV
jgi:hypothetical protein